MVKHHGSNTVRFNRDKFKELIVYIAGRCEKHSAFGATKLNKILFYSDFIAYKNLGHAITGAEYFALERGPAPKPLVPIRDEMIEDKDIAQAKTDFQHRIIALRNPDLSEFSAEEIVIVDRVIHYLRHKSSGIVSLLSHAFLGWQAAWEEGSKKGENITIPYGTTFVANPPLDEFEQAHGLSLAKQHGWLSNC